MKLPRYQAYRETQIPWLGRIPAHWGLERLKYCAGIRNEKTSAIEANLPYLGLENIESWTARRVVAVANIESEGMASRFCPGDILFGKLRPYLAKVYESQEEGVCTGEFLVLQPRSTIAPFLKYQLLATEFIRIVDSSTYGAKMPRANWDFIGNMPIPIPPPNEQLRVVTFLNCEIAKIDTLIAKQERLIALLQEKHQALISHAVTKGLNPDAPMKDSGVEWLGEVPAHWGISALGYYATITTGSTPDRNNPDYWDGDIPWLKTGEINYELVTEAEEFITQTGLDNSSTKIADVGTLLIAMYGQGATRGRVAILGIRAAYNQACAAISFNGRLKNEFARYFFMAAYAYIRDTGNETSQMNLSAGIIAKVKILIPTPDEQERIVAYLDQQITKLNLLINKANRAVTLLTTRRAALISAAVTGKIDVRGYAN